jgi:hypothetical protein
MLKRDWTLLLVRGFGLYLLAQAILSVPGLLGLAYAVAYHWDSLFTTTEGDSIRSSLRFEYGLQTVSNLGRFFICGIAGLVFVRSRSVPWLGLPELAEAQSSATGRPV